MIEVLKKHKDLSIKEVSRETGYGESVLKEAQLKMLRSKVKRNNLLWEVASYGR